jgi:hypothetical protein
MAISVPTLNEHVACDCKLFGYCRTYGSREVDLDAMIAAGYGHVALADIGRRNRGEPAPRVPRLTCRVCGAAFSLMHAPPTTGAGLKTV